MADKVVIVSRFVIRARFDPLPFSRIDEIGAGMYKGEHVTQAERHEAGVREKLEKRAANAPR